MTHTPGTGGAGRQAVPAGPRMKGGRQAAQVAKSGVQVLQPGTLFRQTMDPDSCAICCSKAVNACIKVDKSCKITFHKYWPLAPRSLLNRQSHSQAPLLIVASRNELILCCALAVSVVSAHVPNHNYNLLESFNNSWMTEALLHVVHVDWP